MKLKALLVAALFALGVTAAVAIAKPPPGKGGPPAAVAAKLAAKKAAVAAKAAKVRAQEMNRCRGGHMLLRGDLVSTSLASSELTLLVKQANMKGRSRVGTQATVVVGDKTRVLRFGPSSLDKLEPGDRVKVLVRMCRDAEGDAALLAKQVVAVRAKADDDDDDGETTTSTSTETTGSTSTETTTTP